MMYISTELSAVFSGLIGRHDCRPTVKEFNELIRDKVAEDWQDLGIQLEIAPEQLRIIKNNYPQNIKMCCTKMFENWIENDYTANWDKLIKALERINHNALAEDIRTIQGNVTQCHYGVYCVF